MKYTKLELNAAWDSYTCTEVSDAELLILGNMFADDVRDNAFSYKQTLADDTLRGQSGNFVSMIKENGDVVLRDLYSEMAVPVEFKVTHHAFMQLLNDWQNKVCRPKPKEVLIKYDGSNFIIETKD